ncbi:MAG TPA: hypothetical protein VE994_18690, partial [Terriglobales bacterium]|nr:hypothetical protein [Terriglobales bacterium]
MQNSFQRSGGEKKPVAVYESSEETRETLTKKPDVEFGLSRTPHLTITVNDTVKYQEIDGFGASLTDSSAWLLSKKLTEAQRSTTLEM